MTKSSKPTEVDPTLQKKCGAPQKSWSWPCANTVHNGEKYCHLHGGRNKAKEARERERQREDDRIASDECLGMVYDALAARIDMDGCPPMFYPEAIANVANLPRRAIMKATGCNEKRVAKADEAELILIIQEFAASDE